jgi:hypothetical protein
MKTVAMRGDGYFPHRPVGAIAIGQNGIRAGSRLSARTGALTFHRPNRGQGRNGGMVVGHSQLQNRPLLRNQWRWGSLVRDYRMPPSPWHPMK